MKTDELVACVLAAGSSSRFGQAKQLLPFGRDTLLGFVVGQVNRSTIERIVVVLGREAERVRGSVGWGRATVVDNLSYGSGCAYSLLAGLDAAGDCAGVMLLLGDQPGVGPEIIDQVYDQWRANRPWASATQYNDGLGHPLVFARAAFGELRSLHGDKAVWKLIEGFPDRVAKTEVDAPLPPDLDTPEDYERVRAAMAPLS
ncbi:MAG: nucleotidyltransferase family protein [Anaerolineales bacterium]